MAQPVVVSLVCSTLVFIHFGFETRLKFIKFGHRRIIFFRNCGLMSQFAGIRTEVLNQRGLWTNIEYILRFVKQCYIKSNRIIVRYIEILHVFNL